MSSSRSFFDSVLVYEYVASKNVTFLIHLGVLLLQLLDVSIWSRAQNLNQDVIIRRANTTHRFAQALAIVLDWRQKHALDDVAQVVTANTLAHIVQILAIQI